jgi:hypothetical protein
LAKKNNYRSRDFLSESQTQCNSVLEEPEKNVREIKAMIDDDGVNIIN